MHSNQSRPNWVLRGARMLGGVLMAAGAMLAQAITINVVRPDGTPINVPFRWTLQEDKTWDVVPGVTGTAAVPNPSDTLSLQFHRSHMPVVESGQTLPTNTTGIAATATALAAGKRYFLSVLPNGLPDGSPAFQMSGAPIRANANGSMPTTVRVVVNPTPIQTAQISVLLYHDSNPINNSPDAIGGQEYGLCGWDIHIYDAGGTYGASGGRFGFDAFGNPLGTTYLTDGSVDQIGTLDLKTDANGVFRVKNLAPAKYTVFAVPPSVKPPITECPRYYPDGANPPLTPWPEEGQFWMQTHTIEGTQGVDAWVKANEPAYFKEFGPPGHHVFIGFVPSFAAPSTGTGAATGQVINVHMSRPPNFTFNDGLPVSECRIGLNESASLAVGGGRGVYAGKCNPDGTFSIPGLKPGTRYQLAVWDKPLDNVFGLYDFVTPATGSASVNLGKVPVFNWFGRVAGKVCHDPAATGACAATSIGIPGQAVNLRFRDGSIYQSVATDDEGNYEFAEVFPFFNWLVAEVDYLRFEATGLTALADAGGALPANPVWPNRGQTTPYPGGPETTTGPAILQGVQTFLGQTNVLDFGKRPYTGSANGGISGKINYSSTRAESDPRYAFAENNEPGIPGVTVRLYRASPSNPKVPLVPQPAGFPMTAVSDSWDASLPTDCAADPAGAAPPAGKVSTDCYDGLRNFNQLKGAVYDGGYAFVDLAPGKYIVEVVPPSGYEVQKEEDKNVDFGDSIVVSTLSLPPECVGTRPTAVPAELDLFPGVAIPPEYRDAPGRPRPYCNRKAVTLNAGLNAANDFQLFTKTPVAGHIVGMILDDLANEFNPNAPTFGEKFAPPFMPVSLRDHTGREFSRVYSDRFGTYNALVPSTFAFNVPMPSGVAPNMVSACLNSPYMPVKNPATGADMLDPITGKTLMQPDPHHNKSYSQFCYTFQYLPGKTTYLDTPVLPIAAFAGPQQFSLDCAHPSAVPGIRSVNGSANAGPWISGAGQTLTIRSMGATQVLNPLWDANNPGGTEPRTISRDFGFGSAPGTVSFNGVDLPASYITSWTNEQIVINVLTVTPGVTSGTVLVKRSNGNVSPRGVTVHIGGTAPTVVRAGGSIQAAVNAASEGALITVEPGLYEETVIVDRRIRLQGYGAGGTLINAVTQPAEKLMAWRRAMCDKVMGVALTPGGGTGANFLLPGQLLPTTYQACLDGDTADNAPLLFGDAEAPGFFVMLKSDGNATNPQPRASSAALQIDGFTISGADQGGGIIANGFARALQITNNLISGNQGLMAGGIRLGHPTLTSQELPVGSRNTDVLIRNNEVVQNGDTAGATGGGGGGIGIYLGANNYNVTKNYVCGNFSTGNGGGLAHLGVSNNGVIHDNKFLWNSSFNQGFSVQGGAVSIAGQASQAAANGLSTGSGSVRISSNTFHGNLAGAGDGGGISLLGTNGNEVGTTVASAYLVSIVNNVIVNNVAGVAGGGIALKDAPNTQILNNTIARNDNVSTAARAFAPGLLQNNTNNTALSSSLPQFGAGIASYPHSPVLALRLGAVTDIPAAIRPQALAFSFPSLLDNNILYQNRVFHWNQPAVPTPTTPAGLVFDGFSDLEVLDAFTPAFEAATPTGNNAPGTFIPTGTQPRMNPTDSLMTSITGYTVAAPDNNVKGLQANVQYWNANSYNGGRDSVLLQVEASVQATAQSPSVAAAFDEGGNFIDVRFGPLTQNVHTASTTPGGPPVVGVPYFDYRIRSTSQAAGIGRTRNPLVTLNPIDAFLLIDRNGAARPVIGNWDAGAYHRSTSATAPY